MGIFDRKPNIEKLKEKEDVEGLIKALKFERYKDVDLIRDAVEALGKTGKPAVEPLIQALKDEDHGVRSSAAEALGMIGHKSAVEPLIQTLKDKHWYVRKASAVALGNIGDERAVEPLGDSLKDDEEEVREAAKWYLAKFKAKKSTKKKPGVKRTVKRDAEKLKEQTVKGVTFVKKKYRHEKAVFGIPVKYTYEVYTAENKKQAWEFIKTKSVNKEHYYIEVNVGDVDDPEVIVGLDIQGTYEV